MDFNIFFNSRAAIESRIFSVGLRKLFHHIKYYYNTSMLSLLSKNLSGHFEPVTHILESLQFQHFI